MKIPLDIGLEESLGRIILHSFHYSESKKKIRPEAFIPSPHEIDEISVLRYEYTNANFCKIRGLIIAERRNTPANPCKFVGVAFLYNKEVNGISETSEDCSCRAIATPLDENDKLRVTGDTILITDAGVPMHADLKYSFEVVQDKPISQIAKSKIIKNFCGIAQNRFFKDVDLENKNWVGEPINL